MPAAAAAPAATAPANEGLTIAEMASALREAGDFGRKVAVMGMGPGVGTTLTAVALARTLAQQDARVMLIDLSLERPNLAAIAADPRMPGVADLVRGTASFGQIITRDRFSRVQVITAGRVGADAPAVYLSERLSIGIEALSRAYDHVIIDAGALPNVPADRIARLAPCGVLVASGQAAAQAARPARAARPGGVQRHRGVHRYAARARRRDAARRRGVTAPGSPTWPD